MHKSSPALFVAAYRWCRVSVHRSRYCAHALYHRSFLPSFEMKCSDQPRHCFIPHSQNPSSSRFPPLAASLRHHILRQRDKGFQEDVHLPVTHLQGFNHAERRHPLPLPTWQSHTPAVLLCVPCLHSDLQPQDHRTHEGDQKVNHIQVQSCVGKSSSETISNRNLVSSCVLNIYYIVFYSRTAKVRL